MPKADIDVLAKAIAALISPELEDIRQRLAKLEAQPGPGPCLRFRGNAIPLTWVLIILQFAALVASWGYLGPTVDVAAQAVQAVPGGGGQ